MISGNSLDPSSLGLSLNLFDPSQQATSRQPRGTVLVDGTPINWISFEVESTSRSDSDTFKVTLPSGTNATLPLNYYVSAEQIIITIMSTPSNSLIDALSDGMDTIIIGEVDHLSYEPHAGLITVSGRDYSSKLMDKKSSIKYQNMKASDIVSKIASNAGLKPVIVETQLKSGKYYQIDHARLTDQTSDWDLLQYLAREENYIVYIKGSELHFEPKGQGSQTPYIIDLSLPGFNTTGSVSQSNAISVEMNRNFVIGKGAKVSVNSWNLKGKQNISSTATSQGSGTPLNFNYTFPNLSTDQANQRAKSKLHDIIQHELTINVQMPADNLLTPQTPIQIIGTQTDFDQIYYVKHISREMSFNRGYVMSIEAMNQRAKNTTSST